MVKCYVTHQPYWSGFLIVLICLLAGLSRKGFLTESQVVYRISGRDSKPSISQRNKWRTSREYTFCAPITLLRALEARDQTLEHSIITALEESNASQHLGNQKSYILPLPVLNFTINVFDCSVEGWNHKILAARESEKYSLQNFQLLMCRKFILGDQCGVVSLYYACESRQYLNICILRIYSKNCIEHFRRQCIKKYIEI